VSWILAASIIGNVFAQYPLGVLADRWSRRGVIITTALATAILSLAIIWSVSSWILWPVMIVVGSTAFGVYTVSLAMLGDYFEGPDLIAGSAAFGAMWGIGGIVGPPIAGAALDLFGLNAIPLTLSIPYLLLLAAMTMSGGKLVRTGGHA
jgi:MFS family permease